MRLKIDLFDSWTLYLLACLLTYLPICSPCFRDYFVCFNVFSVGFIKIFIYIYSYTCIYKFKHTDTYAHFLILTKI